MSTAVMMERIREASPRLKGRMAGICYLLAVGTAVWGESLRGGLSFALGFIAIAFYIALTLLFYDIFKPVNRGIALLATLSSLAGLTFEAVRWNPRGVDVALVFHAFFCLLIGYLAFRSVFLPPVLGALIVFGGLSWLTNLSPALADRLSPYNEASGFIGEAPLMLWLLVIGVNIQRWKEQPAPQ